MTPETVVGLLASPERLRVVAALVLGATSIAELTEATGLDAKAVGKALRKLEDGGLVGPGYRLRAEVLTELAKAAAPGEQADDHGYGDSDPRTEALLRTFVKDGRLVGMPAQRGRRRVLLEHLVQSFEPGVRYPEKEVNVIVRAWCEGGTADYVAVRRYLIDEGLLTRGEGEYWRSGGWLDVLPED
ncbi:DUF2087 domain-containing protein [Allokutzneria sp. A3M-2-11 16]|uniref:DUF2087 domain-containing protein n=1 Tax=Allokutzneria sp. A3M-2-11 16 TaxID=2962043 RepID=UPI0020B6EC1D|nr:DUF2087 domain-containing protein [Allokutzneria sp. A3M-2-11 16]MCP3798510.1 DUF2087 domain-containing protein [Allokutzneria sp. A3M-2-11 16]